MSPTDTKAPSQPTTKLEDFDQLLDLIGSEGRFQKILLYGYLGPLSLVTPLFMYNFIFMVFEPDHWCHAPGRNESMDLETWKNIAIPLEHSIDGSTRFSQCYMYGKDHEEVKPCQHGWEFDRSDFDNTLPSEFNWVCDKGQYGTHALTCASIGNALGAIFLGQTADKIGRKPIIFTVYLWNVLCRLMSLFVADKFLIFLAVQTIHGMAFPLTFIVSSMLVCEISGPAFRAWLYTFTWIIWVIGFSLLPVIAWLTKTWFFMGLATSLPGLFLMLYWWLVPESPHWLLSRGNISEAARALEKIADWNGTRQKLEALNLEHVLTSISDRDVKVKSRVGLLSLFSKIRLARNTILISIEWATNNVVNLLIMLVTHKIPGNQFLNFFFLGIVEVPASYLGGFLADRIGRTWTMALFYFLCALSCAGVAGCYWFDAGFYEILGLAIVAKFAITVTFMVSFIQVTELFPTQLRSTGSGFASTFGSMASILAPYAAYSGKIHDALPYVFLTGISIAATISAYFVPETLDRKLPETIEEANHLGTKDTGIFKGRSKSEVFHIFSSSNISLVSLVRFGMAGFEETSMS